MKKENVKLKIVIDENDYDDVDVINIKVLMLRKIIVEKE